MYKECDKGKDKYAQFQVKGHNNIAQFLLEPNSSTQSEGHILWDHVSTSASYESRYAVLIAIVSETYDHLREVLQYAMSQHGAETSASTSDPMPNPEMISKTCTDKNRVSGEIQVL